VGEPFPVAAGQAETALEIGDAGFDAAPEALELVVEPAFVMASIVSLFFLWNATCSTPPME
jgi:hypothetical protein